jgi:hypothetical protein
LFLGKPGGGFGAGLFGGVGQSTARLINKDEIKVPFLFFQLFACCIDLLFEQNTSLSILQNFCTKK